MNNSCLISDISPEEAYLCTKGTPIIGTGNLITDMFKFIGMYSDLERTKRTSEILFYQPEKDHFFRHENMGYTLINSIISKERDDISRRFLKGISRKWPISRVRVSFDTKYILTTMHEYICSHEFLLEAWSDYLDNKGTQWDEIMPIQYEFLGVRIEDHHTNWQVAQSLVNDLSQITLGA